MNCVNAEICVRLYNNVDYIRDVTLDYVFSNPLHQQQHSVSKMFWPTGTPSLKDTVNNAVV